MKLTAKIIVSIIAIYIVALIAFAAYFSLAERYKGVIESNLSTLFQRDVTIDDIETDWDGLSPQFEIKGFSVKGDTEVQDAFSFSKLSAQIDPISILLLWPSFSQFAVESPEIEIVNLEDGSLQLAGLKLKSNKSSGLNPKRYLSWLLNNENISWHKGLVIWRRLNGEIERYEDISFVYERQRQARSISAAVNFSEGSLAFKSFSNGDVINSSDWDASLEILGGRGERYLGSDDLSLTVSGGEGQLLLKQLSTQKVQDFLLLTGISGAHSWIVQSQLFGDLRNAQFNFSGPLLDFDNWSLSAKATDIGFKSRNSLPSMNNLNGSIHVSSSGGEFLFMTEEAKFTWSKWFEKPILITKSSGKVVWDLSDDEKIKVILSDADFNNQAASIKNINANAEITKDQTLITNFSDLFKTSSIKDLSFEANKIVKKPFENLFNGGIFVDASAQFEVFDLALLGDHMPKDPRISKFKLWWENAVLTGAVTDGDIAYQGIVTKDALYEGTAQLIGKANYSDIDLDYGYERNWPLLKNASGVAQVNNAEVKLTSSNAKLGEDQIKNAEVTINSLYRLDRSLDVEGSLSSPISTVMDFIFNGPLIKKQALIDNKNSDGLDPSLPITSQGGLVHADIVVNIPLRNMKAAKVIGSAKVENGQFLLPEGVPVNNVRGSVNFTENSVVSKNVTAQFLGGDVVADIATIEAAQPPIMKITAEGSAKVNEMKPWIGEHMLSLLEGESQWLGTIIVDGPQVEITASSDLEGIEILAPAPLNKRSLDSQSMLFNMNIGKDVQQNMSLSLGKDIFAKFVSDKTKNNHFFDQSIISLGGDKVVKNGINFDINFDQINLDDWIEKIIEICEIKVEDVTNTLFLDSMRSIKVRSSNPDLLGRKFGELELLAVSSNGGNWIGSVKGDNINGALQAEPRNDVGSYRFNLSKFHIPEEPDEIAPLEPIDNALTPDSYPIVELSVNSFRYAKKQLGRLKMRGEPIGGAWKLTNFELEHLGVNTTAQGQWVNTAETGTISRFNIQTDIDEAGGALQELDMDGFVSKGEGTLTANINWIGAPHEYDSSRLNGDFDLRVQDGELVKIEPGSGKLLGLLNFNAIARRLTLDFSDVFSSGLEFDRMRYSGVFADGEAIMQQAYIFTPSVFVNMEGKLDLNKELIDMEIHLSPELGGNLTLLSALANPAAGALVFLTQQLFKNELRSNSYKSYRALGTWEDFEIVEFDLNEERALN